MDDELLSQLRKAGNDSERARLVFASIMQSVPQDALQALHVLSVPHWFDPSIFTELTRREPAVTEDSFGELGSRGLVRRSGETFSVVSEVRTYVLSMLAQSEVARLRDLSKSFAEFFLRRSPSTFATAAEGIYHALAADPSGGAALLLNAASTWKGEPLFAYEAVDRLATNAIEQRDRHLLDASSAARITLVELMVPRRRPPPGEEVKILSNLLETAPTDDAFRLQLRLRLGLAQLNAGEISDAEENLRAARDGYEKQGNEHMLGEALLALGRAALRQDRYAEAKACFELAAEKFERHQLISARAHCTESLADISFYQGEYPAAERGLTEALDAFHATGALIGEANTRIMLGQLLALQGRFADSSTHIDKAKAIYQPLNQGLGLANSSKATGVLLREQGKHREALERLEQAAAQYGDTASGRANCDMLSASILIELNEAEEAEKLLRRAAETFEEMQDRYSLALTRREMGLLDESRSALGPALATLAETTREFEALPNPVEAAISGVAAGRVAVKLGFPAGFDPRAVAQSARGAASVFETNGVPRRLKEAQELLGMLASAASTRA